MNLAALIILALALSGCGCTLTAGFTFAPPGGYFSVKLADPPVATQPTTQTATAPAKGTP